jgi:hypothetical protein
MSRISVLEQQIQDMQTDFNSRLTALASDPSASRLAFRSAVIVAVISTVGVLGAALISQIDLSPAPPSVSCGDVYQDAIDLYRVNEDWRYPAGSEEQKHCDVNGFLTEIEAADPST